MDFYELFSSLKKQRSPRLYVQFHTFNIHANRVAIVSSVTAKIFNPSKCWTITIQILLNDTLLISACYYLLPVTFCLTFFCSMPFYLIQCLVDAMLFVRLDSFAQYSNYSVNVLS